MDNSSQNSSSVKEKQKWTDFLTIDIAIAFLIFFIIFAILFYFNIITLNRTFPFLSLPIGHQNTPAYTNPTQPSQAQTPSPVDTTKGKQELVNYISQTIASTYTPSSYTTPTFTTTKHQNSFSADWIKNANIHFYTFILYNKTRSDSEKLLQNTIATQENKDVTQATADQVTQAYLRLSNSSSWNCGTIRTLTVCQKFFMTKAGKEGYGIAKDITDTALTVFSCLIPIGSDQYNTTQACYQQL